MELQTGGPWTALANTQLDFLTLIQNAEVTGIYGITFWIVMVNILIFNWMDRPYPNHLFVMIFVIGCISLAFIIKLVYTVF